ncbi:MAG TPA: hypothetical protein VK540_26745 [Polyangiaceae bacterium]|nr:hypothetical protein [Polyangiaceae bacterium]
MTVAAPSPTRQQSRTVCAFYRLELFGFALERAAGDERTTPLVLAVMAAERIAQLTSDRIWS